jgi:hypothetical protein
MHRIPEVHGLIDRLMANAHSRIFGVIEPKLIRDLFGTPGSQPTTTLTVSSSASRRSLVWSTERNTLGIGCMVLRRPVETAYVGCRRLLAINTPRPPTAISCCAKVLGTPEWVIDRLPSPHQRRHKNRAGLNAAIEANRPTTGARSNGSRNWQNSASSPENYTNLMSVLWRSPN